MENNYSNKSSKLNALQSIRAIAFLAIFTFHTSIQVAGGMGVWGVSLFLVLSGFVMVYSYYGQGRFDKVSVKMNIQFSLNKIKKIYPLYVITTIAMIPFCFTGRYFDSIEQLCIKFILNLLLIQDWIPMDQSSINGVAWYLCVMCFLYFIFPWVLQFIEKKSKRQAKVSIIIFFLIQLLVGFLGAKIPSPTYIEGGWWTENFSNWFIYKFPLVRALDFLIGCNLGVLFVKRDEKKEVSCTAFTLVELTGVVFAILGNVFSVMLKPISIIQENILAAMRYRWWTFSAAYIFSSCILIYAFAVNKGIISKRLTNRVTIYLGNISQYTFLIHDVVLHYVNGSIILLLGKVFCDTYGCWINFTVGLILTLIATKVWMKIIHRDVRF